MLNFKTWECFICALLASTATTFSQLLPGYVTDKSAEKIKVSVQSYATPPALQFPYVSTYYVKPIVSPDEDTIIKFFVTDWNNSKVRKNDDSFRFSATIVYSSDLVSWQKRILKNLPSGDHEFNLGKLPAGDYTFGIMCADNNNRKSHTVWHEFRSSTSYNAEIPADKIRVMDATQLAKYGITMDNDRYKTVNVEVGEIDGLSNDALLTQISNAVNAAVAKATVKDDTYSIFVPVHNNKSVYYGWRRGRVVYGAKYNKERVEAEAKANGLGIQKMIDDAATDGIRKFVFMPGTYRVSAFTPIELPANMIIDLNGSTVKMNEFTGCTACVFTIRHKYDAHLINGTVEGDYYEHDYAGSPSNSEWPMGVSFTGDTRYSSFENLTIKNITGYGASNGTAPYDHTFPGQVLFYGKGCFTNGAISFVTGRVVETEPCQFTSVFRDISAFTNKYISVSKYLGYQGIRTKSWYYTAAFYNADKQFIHAEIAYQYRSVYIPKNAKFMRITIEEESIEKADACELTGQLFKYPWNCAYKNIKFVRCRAVGLAPAAMRNMLIEGNEFSYSGENLARCAFDAEDGWDSMQDVYIHDNWFHDNPNNELLTCAGHNFIIEGNECAVYLWERTQSACVRGNKFKSASFRCGNRNRTMIGRYYNNTYRDSVNLGMNQKPTGWDIVISGELKSYEPGKTLNIASSFGGCIRDAVIENANIITPNFENCAFIKSHFTMTSTSFSWKNISLTDCVMQHANKTNVFENCRLVNTQFETLNGGNMTIIGSTFDNVTFNAGYWSKPVVFTMTGCSVRNTNKTFFRVPVYSIGKFDITNCIFDCGKKPVFDIYDLRPQDTDNLPASFNVTDCGLSVPNTKMIAVTGSSQKNEVKKLTISSSNNKFAIGSALIDAKEKRPSWTINRK